MRKKYLRKQFGLVVCCLPAVLIFSMFVLYSIVYSFFLSLHKWDGFVQTPWIFVGFNNFMKVLQDEVFWISLKNTLVFSATTTFIWSTAGLILALLISSRPKGMTFFRTLFFAPAVIGTIMVALLWRRVYEPNFGMLNSMLYALHLGEFTHGWLQEPRLVIFSLAQVYIWQYTGYSMVIYIAGLQTIPNELFNAARIDGASTVEVIRYITLPLMLPFIGIVVMLNIIGSMKVFALVYSMTRGGPMHASEVITTYMYLQAFEFNNMGYASAITFLLAILILIFSLSFRKLIRGRI